MSAAKDNSYGVLAVDDYWICVLPTKNGRDKCGSFATREEAYAWMETNDDAD